MARRSLQLSTILAAFFILALNANVTSASPNLKFRVLSQLDKYEPFDAHLFHAGHLWVGRSRKDLAAFYQLEVYDVNGKSIATKSLPHSLRHVTPYGKSSVLIVGIAVQPNQTFYSIATVQGGAISVQTRPIPLEGWADRGVAANGKLIFTDPGGFDDGSPASQPLKTLFTITSAGIHFLNARIRGPQHLVPVGKDLFIIEHESIASGGTNLVRYNTVTETMNRLFTAPRNFLNNMVYLEKAGLLALSENGTNSVLLVDPQCGDLKATVTIPAGDPRGLAEMGHCLVVGSDNPKQVSFVDLNSPGKSLVAQWDLSAAGPSLYRLRDLAVDADSGRVFGRSSVPCDMGSTCTEERNGVVLVEEEGKATFSACR